MHCPVGLIGSIARRIVFLAFDDLEWTCRFG